MVFSFKAGFARNVKRNFRWLQSLLLAAVLGLQGCGPNSVNPNVITGMSFDGRSHRPSDCLDGDASERRNCSSEEIESLMFAEIDREISLSLVGTGTCEAASVDFGDGTPPVRLTYFDIGNPSQGSIKHTYTGWPGKKLIRVKGEAGCYGEVTGEITVGRGPDGIEFYRLDFGPNNNVCNAVPHMPPLRKGSGVRIITDGNVIDYGLPQFNASGDLLGSTPPDYPFPMLRAFSLVYKVGSSPPIQGEAGAVTFKAPETAPLEICLNDFAGYLNDNSGRMRIDITVNEISAE